MRCKTCGQPINKIIQSSNYYSNRLCELLKLEPIGKDVNGKSYYSLYLRGTLVKAVEALEKLLKKKTIKTTPPRKEQERCLVSKKNNLSLHK